ncbi:MAG: TIGR00296 family protein [Methanomicrobiales archaeon]|nr:TIGR00296 family protein [Methanomicrobiales archaeon]
MYALTDEEGILAVNIARQALRSSLAGEEYTVEDLPPVFQEKRGVFVTLKQRGELRGCIGIPYPVMPLGEALIEAAVCSGLNDPRFLPLHRSELPETAIEITILTPPEKLVAPPERRPEAIQVGRHGLIVRGGGCSGLLLPQVPCECGWGSREFLDHTCIKAGLRPDCWKRSDVDVFFFEGQIFHE